METFRNHKKKKYWASFHCCLISTWFSYFCIFGWMLFFFLLMSPSNRAIRLSLWWKSFVELSAGAGAPAEFTQGGWDWTSECWGKEMSDTGRVKVKSFTCVVWKFLFLHSCSLYRFSSTDASSRCGKVVRSKENMKDEKWHILPTLTAVSLYGFTADAVICCTSAWKPATLRV